MPFVTEELYQHLPRFKDQEYSDSIMVAPYPTPQQVQPTVSWFSADLWKVYIYIDKVKVR
jgi:valyl-tRNA synthetase